MRKVMLESMIVGVATLLLVGCSTTPRTEGDRMALEARVAETIKQARQQDPSLASFFDEAAGYAVFPTVGKGGVGVGGAYGRGMLHEGGQAVGYCTLTQASIGFQLGGQKYSEIICFETPAALAKFKSGNFAFAAQATAVALKSGVGANAKYDDGVAVFTMGEAGLMYEASVGGQKFSYQPL